MDKSREGSLVEEKFTATRETQRNSQREIKTTWVRDIGMY